MKIYNVQQGTDEWLKLRLGKITASRFGDIMTQPRAKKDVEAGLLSDTAKTYMIELITEVMTEETRQLDSEALRWGSENEPMAREWYELENVCEVEQVGFVEYESKDILNARIGGSPDGLIGKDGILEIKCPYNSIVHTEYLLGGNLPKSYTAQIQGNLWITDRKWADFVSYNPRVKEQKNQIHIRRIERDEEYIAKLKANLINFIKILDERNNAI